MAVYMIRGGTDGPIKIGHSNNPASRLVSLQIGNWVPLVIYRVFEGDEEEERRLHLLFREFRITGEWYRFDASMAGDVGLFETTIADTIAKNNPFRHVPPGYDKRNWRLAVRMWGNNLFPNALDPHHVYHTISQHRGPSVVYFEEASN